MSRLKQLREKMKEYQVDGLLIASPYNRRYVTDFTGTAGAALITETAAIFITDFRYVEQAKEQAKEFIVVKHEKQILAEIKQQINALGISRLGFEEEHVTYADYKQYEEAFAVELVATKDLIESLRLFKTEKEIAILKQAAQIADQSFQHILSYIKPGVRELEIANELEYYMRKLGATSSSFDIIVASGVRSSLPHGVASEKKIAAGELVTLDYGALYKGYCSDITRTVAVGEINNELKEIYEVVLGAQERGTDQIKPGMTGKEADALTRDYISERGYGDYFGHSTGHGIGLEVHESPGLASSSDIVLEKNMVVTVEPGIYLPNIGGCRIEDDIVLTETGNERLTLATKELIQL